MNLGPGKTTPFPIAARLPAIDRFVCVYADTPEARQHHYRLRYRVFCEETRFEDPGAFPDEVEYDRYDDHAKHFIVWDRQERQWAGALRMIDASSTRLPSEEILGAPLEGLSDRRSRAVECSRICILSQYRKISRSTFIGNAPGEGHFSRQAALAIYTQEDNDVLLRLIRASLSLRPNVEHCYFIVTAALSRVLSRFGIPLTQVGNPVQHRGTRIPFRYAVQEAEKGMLATTPAFSAIVERSAAYIAYSDFMGRGYDKKISIPVHRQRFASGAWNRITS